MRKMKRVLKSHFQVALCVIFMCSSLALTQSINVNSKHVVHSSRKLSNTLAPLSSPDVLLTTLHDDDNEDEEEESDDEYSSENEFGSSGSEIIFGAGGAIDGELDEFQKNDLPFFLKDPENEYIVKKRPAVLKCTSTHALEVFIR